MLKFQYQAAGGKQEVIFAESKKKALELLANRGIQVTELTLIGKDAANDPNQAVKKLNRAIALPFLSRLLQLHGAGLPLGDTLRILQTRLQDPKLRALAIALWHDLSEGKSFGMALKACPNVFTDDIIYPLEAAESTGNIAPVLKDVIHLLTERAQLKKKIIAGMSYPIVVTLVAIIVVVFFLFFLLPRIEGMLTTMGGSLTLPARILIGFSSVLLYGGPMVAIGCMVAYIALKAMRKSEAGVLRTDRWWLKIPVLGGIVQYTEICRISNLLATLLGSGVNLTEAMRLTENSIRNQCLREQYQKARTEINDGVALTVAFKKANVPVFTDLALDILMVGENTANMHSSFREVYRLHNAELDARLSRLTKAITSGALGFAFFLVSVLALGIVSSIMQFSSTIKF